MHSDKVITIRPIAKHNGLSLLVLGFLLLFVAMVLNASFWSQFKLQLMFFTLLSFIVIFIGVLKILEPNTSYTLTPKNILYIHKYGHWQLDWADIIRIGTVSRQIGLTQQELPYLGIKLTNLHRIAEHITPRLANRLLHEQKVLLQLAITNTDDVSNDNIIISFEPFELNAKLYKGPIAAWLFRCEQLAKHYGYHLYLPIDSFDRNTNEFLTLLNDCLRYAKTHPDEEQQTR